MEGRLRKPVEAPGFLRAHRVIPTLLPLLLSACGGMASSGRLERGGSPEPNPPAGAAPVSAATAVDATVGFSVVADSIPGDSATEALIRPYREAMGSRIEEVVGEAATDLAKGWPEGPLGNFAADALLWTANSRLEAPADMALMNNGGLRVPLSRGPITVGKMFELMPFENLVSILTLTGEQVLSLAQDIARRGGEPIAGFSFHIAMEGGERVARDVLVGGEPPGPDSRYRLVTPDYLANGGDEISTLLEAVDREDYPLLVRDAFIDYLREIEVIRSRIEGRITGEVGR